MRKLSSLIAALTVLVSLAGCGGPNPGACTTPVTADITTPTTWTTQCAYEVADVYQVKAALTVQPGALVRFKANAGLVVETSGSLNAVGTASAPITFTGTTETKGFWRGLAFRSNNPANELTHVNVEFAGSDAFCCDYFEGNLDIKAAVSVGGATAGGSPTVKITQSTLSTSGGFGVSVFDGARLTGFSGNTFRGNAKSPVNLPLASIGALDSATVYSGMGSGLSDPNLENFIRVKDSPSSDTAVSQTVNKLDVPYGMGAGVTSGRQEMEYAGALTVSAGVRFEFEANAGLKILETGALTVNGTAADKVTFTGRVQTRGYWVGLAFRSNGNTINNAVVSNGGGVEFCCDYFDTGVPSVKANIVVGGATLNAPTSVTLNNVSVTDSLNNGIYKFSNATVNTATVSFSGNNQDKNF